MIALNKEEIDPMVERAAAWESQASELRGKNPTRANALQRKAETAFAAALAADTAARRQPARA